MRSIRSPALVVLLVVLVLLSARSVSAGTWISYDDDTYGGAIDVPWALVRFSLPSGMPQARLLRARFYLSGEYAYGPFEVHVLEPGLPPGRDLMTPITTTAPTSAGWFEVDLSGRDFVVSGDFYVGAKASALPLIPRFGYDSTATTVGRSYVCYDPPQATGACLQHTHDLMIRLEVEPIAGNWMIYDDGTYSGQTDTPWALVLFSLPSGWSQAKLLTARFYVSSNLYAFRVHVLQPGYPPGPDLVTPVDVVTWPTSVGWFDVDLAGKDIVVSGDFYIGAETFGPLYLTFGRDSTPSTVQRSYVCYDPPQDPGKCVPHAYDLMVRLEVEQYPPPSAAPVGGLTYGVDRVAVVSPWLAVIGLVGCVATVAVIVKKRSQ
jgi:hypothetical protein